MAQSLDSFQSFLFHSASMTAVVLVATDAGYVSADTTVRIRLGGAETWDFLFIRVQEAVPAFVYDARASILCWVVPLMLADRYWVLGAALGAYHLRQQIGLVRLRDVNRCLADTVLGCLHIQDGCECHILVYAISPTRSSFENPYYDKWTSLTDAVNGLQECDAACNIATMEEMALAECYALTMDDPAPRLLACTLRCQWPSKEIVECPLSATPTIGVVDAVLETTGFQARVKTLRRACHASMPLGLHIACGDASHFTYHVVALDQFSAAFGEVLTGLIQSHGVDYITPGHLLREMKALLVPAGLRGDRLMAVALDGRPVSTYGIGLYELARFAQFYETEPLSLWLGRTPCIYQLLVYIPPSEQTLFNAVDDDAFAGSETLLFMSSTVRVSDVENAARAVLWEMAAIGEPYVNEELVRRTQLDNSWRTNIHASVQSLTTIGLHEELLSVTVRECVCALRRRPTVEV
jgi:hypothetical protein